GVVAALRGSAQCRLKPLRDLGEVLVVIGRAPGWWRRLQPRRAALLGGLAHPRHARPCIRELSQRGGSARLAWRPGTPGRPVRAAATTCCLCGGGPVAWRAEVRELFPAARLLRARCSAPPPRRSDRL